MINKKVYSIIFLILIIVSLLAGVGLVILSVGNIQNFILSIILVAILSASNGAEITLAILNYLSDRKEKSKK